MSVDSESRNEVAAVAQELARHLRWAQERGETELPIAGSPAPPPALADAGRTAPGAPRTAAEERRAAREDLVARPRSALEAVRAELGDCKRCKLCEGRTNLVFGEGSPSAGLVFVGDGPGPGEDERGLPFVGAAGQLLDKMIEAMGFRRGDVYLCSVVKCRPPGDRAPERDELAACAPFLSAQLAAISPKVIVALGQVAAQALLRDETAITHLRGQWREFEGIPVMPTFHPAYLLRSPAEKAKAWEDLKLVMGKLGKDRPARVR